MALTHAKVFCQVRLGNNISTTFTASAANVNDAVIVLVQIAVGAKTPTGVTLTATGWSFTQLVGVFGDTTAGWASAFVAIAPDTTTDTFTITWSGGTIADGDVTFATAIGDDFHGNDTTGGTTTFDAHASAHNASVYANLNVTPANANDAVWYGLVDSATNAAGAYTKGADDTFNDLTEWAILVGNSGVAQTSSWTGSTGAYLQAGITVKPVAAAANQPDEDFYMPRPPQAFDPPITVW